MFIVHYLWPFMAILLASYLTYRNCCSASPRAIGPWGLLAWAIGIIGAVETLFDNPLLAVILGHPVGIWWGLGMLIVDLALFVIGFLAMLYITVRL